MGVLDEKYYFKKISDDRASGVLMHISSLPGPYGIGSLGRNAREFADFLEAAGQKYWQLLPVGPTSYGDSPYQSFSTFAGNPYFIDLEELMELGLISREEVEEIVHVDDETRIDYGRLYYERFKVLRLAFERFNQEDEDFKSFSMEKALWLDDYAMFMAIKDNFEGKSWISWPDEYKYRNSDALERFAGEHEKEINFHKFLQFMFFKQWRALKDYLSEKNIKTIGDLPIYVAEDSSDVWVNPELFQLKDDLTCAFVGGCPPDDFSDVGQLWGNPVYDWDKNEETGFKWWLDRLGASFEIFDCLRLDHFRGFESYWSIPAGDEDAKQGSWQPGPSMKLFSKVKEKYGDLPIIAEDLGFITEEVYNFRIETGYPSMKILQFAFNPDGSSEHIPHNFDDNNIVYVGTHDNETMEGWFSNALPHEIEYARDYFNLTHEEGYTWGVIRGAMTSVARTSIIQMQDLLCLDNSARMNLPNSLGENWKWRMREGAIDQGLIERFKKLTRMTNRLNKQ